MIVLNRSFVVRLPFIGILIYSVRGFRIVSTHSFEFRIILLLQAVLDEFEGISSTPADYIKVPVCFELF